MVYATPAWRKLLVVVANCRHPIAMRFGFVGSTAIDGSLAASPTMSCPNELTFT
jgi:hypothetical protein